MAVVDPLEPAVHLDHLIPTNRYRRVAKRND
jgi:hypothetical protein